MTIAKAATLVRLTISQMGLSHKDHTATQMANKALNLNQSSGSQVQNEAGYFRKFKVQRKDVAAITAAVGRARQVHRNYTTPFGDDGWRLLSATLVMKYTQELRDCKKQFEDAVSDFINNWPSIIIRNKQILGPIFDQNDYPAQSELKKFYDFKNEFRPVPQTDHLMLQIEAEALLELKKDIERQHMEADKAAREELWKRLYEPVKHMAQTLSDKDKTFHKTLIGNIETIIDILPDLNIGRDPKLSTMANEIKLKLCAFTAGQLRKDPTARKQTAAEAASIISKMDAFMGNPQVQ